MNDSVSKPNAANSVLKGIGIIIALGVAMTVTFDAMRQRIILEVEQVVSVADGDTFTIMAEGQEQRVRFRGVDTPELSEPKCGRERELALQARQFVIEQLNAAQRITLIELDRTGDRYGRWLAYVYVDGESLVQRTIDAGLGRVYEGGPRSGWCE